MTKNIEKYIVLFYNEISGEDVLSITEIPKSRLDLLRAFDYEEIIKPFVVRDLEKGMNREQIGIKYGLNNHFGRRIGREIGLYKKAQY